MSISSPVIRRLHRKPRSFRQKEAVMLTVVIRAAITAILITIASSFSLAQVRSHQNHSALSQMRAKQAQLAIPPCATQCTIVAAGPELRAAAGFMARGNRRGDVENDLPPPTYP